MNNLVLNKDADTIAFEQWLIDNGIGYEKVIGLPRHFRVDGIPEHTDILVVEPDMEIKGAARQPLTLNPDMTGSWQLMRSIRRRAPYPRRPLDRPYDSFFEAQLDGTGVDIHILDTGVSNDITELPETTRVVYRFAALADTGSTGDDNGHGSSCSVLAAGSVHGIARGASILSHRALGSNNTGTTGNIIICMGNIVTQYNARSNPAVASMSFAGTGSSAAVNAAIDDLINAGIVVFVAAGNEAVDFGTFVSTYAESDADLVVVGGIMYDGSSYFDGQFGTNWGARVDILGPAHRTETILSTGGGGGPSVTQLFSGTSAACPIVAGIMACYLQGVPKLTNRAQVQAAKQYLLNKATTGETTNHPTKPTLTDRLAYLDPAQTTNSIAGINL